MKNTMKKRIGMVVGFIFAVIVACACMGIVAGAKEKMGRVEKQKAYLENKKEVVKEIQTYLSDSGYPYSGVSLTRKDDGEGGEEFLLLVHHGKLDHLSEDERTMLCEKLADFGEKLGCNASMQVRIQ